MGNYQPVVSLVVEHGYFTDGICQGLAFSPTAISAQVMQQHQLLMRIEDGGFTLILDRDFSGTVKEDITLRFLAHSQDPYFSFYTAGIANLAYSIVQDKDKKISQACYSTKNTNDFGVLNKSEFLCIDEGVQEAQVIRKVNAPLQPTFTIDVHVPCAAFSFANTQLIVSKYVIQLMANALHWKYYFFGELAHVDMEIYDVDSKSPIKFDLCSEPVINKGKAYISQTPIAMSNVFKQKIQLRDKSNSGKVLIKRLPNAALHLIGKERSSSGQAILVAEIYVN